MFNLGMAVQNLCLRSYELGLETFVVGATAHDAIDRICGGSGAMKIVAAVPVGRPATLPASVPRRKELADCVRRDRLGTPFANSR
jgi:nitroreductase